jgi:antitoxin HicB
MKTNTKDSKYYLSLPYTIILRRDEDGFVIARVQELEGCISHGKDETEALSNLHTMKNLWLEDALAAGEHIPEPQPDGPLPSGKWVQRVPRSLHQKLVSLAEQEEVSLNQLVTEMLAEQFGARAARGEKTLRRHRA